MFPSQNARRVRTLSISSATGEGRASPPCPHSWKIDLLRNSRGSNLAPIVIAFIFPFPERTTLPIAMRQGRRTPCPCVVRNGATVTGNPYAPVRATLPRSLMHRRTLLSGSGPRRHDRCGFDRTGFARENKAGGKSQQNEFIGHCRLRVVDGRRGNNPNQRKFLAPWERFWGGSRTTFRSDAYVRPILTPDPEQARISFWRLSCTDRDDRQFCHDIIGLSHQTYAFMRMTRTLPGSDALSYAIDHPSCVMQFSLPPRSRLSVRYPGEVS